MPTAWITDAQELEDEGDVRSELTILLKTAPVERLLSTYAKSSTVIVAPKGFGKTFVLKVKRVALQEDGYECLPKGLIVDRPGASPISASRPKISLLSKSTVWTRIWLIVFSLTVIKSSRHVDLISVKRLIDKVNSPHLRQIMESESALTSFQILSRIVALDYKHINRVLSDVDTVLERMSVINAKVAVFVDNIDEYVDSFLDDYLEMDTFHERYALWHNAQIGAWKALRQLQGINPRIKLFATIRKEAYYYAVDHDAEIQNLDSFAIHLTYTKEDLTKIIENNISIDRNLADPSAEDPIVRLVGTGGRSLVNIGTGQVEHLMQYWLRHCIGRPRDAVAIGKGISEIPRGERTALRVQDKVHEVAVSQIEKLFTEAKAHVGGLDSELLYLATPSNVLRDDDLEEYAKRYDEGYSKRHGSLYSSGEDNLRVFSVLYSLGLLGVVRGAESVAGYRQFFLEFGQVPLGDTGKFPSAKEYVIHPALSDFIIKRNANYVKSLGRYNIIGDRRPWMNADDFVYVAVGDITSYRRRVMKESGTSQAFDGFWQNICYREEGSVDYFSAGDGDKVVLADPSPEKVVRACESLAEQLRNSRFQLNIRFGAHCGFWKLEGGLGGGPMISDVIGVAARIEPLADPGTILASEPFRKSFADLGNEERVMKFAPYKSSCSEKVEEGMVRISKPSEPEELLVLWKFPLSVEGR